MKGMRIITVLKHGIPSSMNKEKNHWQRKKSDVVRKSADDDDSCHDCNQPLQDDHVGQPSFATPLPHGELMPRSLLP